MFLFTFLLYHTRWSLSRGFFNFFLTFFFRLGEVALPLPCTFIIPHLDRFVKGYFEFFLLCSRHNPSFLQLNGSGSHLYSAHLHTMRSVHRVEDLLALVGTHLSWSPHPPLLCLNYITNLAICQDLFEKICWRCDSNAHHPFADSTDDTSHRWENPTRTGGVAHRGTLRNRRTPSAFCTKSYILPRRYLARTSSKEVSGLEPPSVPPKFVMRSRTALHPGTNQGLLLYPYCITTWEICQEGIFLFADFFYSVYLVTHLGVPCGDFPLDIISIPQTAPKVNR